VPVEVQVPVLERPLPFGAQPLVEPVGLLLDGALDLFADRRERLFGRLGQLGVVGLAGLRKVRDLLALLVEQGDGQVGEQAGGELAAPVVQLHLAVLVEPGRVHGAVGKFGKRPVVALGQGLRLPDRLLLEALRPEPVADR
jgi:hypothetical protein